MQLKSVRSLTITTLMKHLFSTHRPCELKAAFPRRAMRIERVVEERTFRVLPDRRPVHVENDGFDTCEPKAWPYDTALPSGLPPIPELPVARPDLAPHRVKLPPERPLISDKSVDVLI